MWLLIPTAWVVLASAPGPSSGRLAAIAAGDCQDPDLITDTRAFASELRLRLGDKFVDQEAIRQRLAPPSRRSPEELARHIETARMVFWEAHYSKALAMTADALDDVHRLPVGVQRWKLMVTGELLYGLILTQVARREDYEAAFARVLRLAPNYRMDPEIYSPGTRAKFHRVRKALAAAPRVPLEVTSVPTGADVYLDGLSVGQTPFRTEILPGKYQVVVTKGGWNSLPRLKQLDGESKLHIDLQFEGSLRLERTACLSSPPGEDERFGKALKLATLLDVEDIVVLRLDRQSAGPSWLAATLLNSRTAQKVREGGLKVEQLAHVPPALPQLTTYVLTGQLGGGEVMVLQPEPIPVPVFEDALDPETTTELLLPDPEPAAVSVVPALTLERVLPTVLGGAGLAIAGGGGWLQYASVQTTKRFNSRYPPGSAPPASQAVEMRRILDTAALQQAFAIGAFVTGTALVATGTALWGVRSGWWGQGDVGLAVGPDSTKAHFRVVW
jgi:hypothetical protein